MSVVVRELALHMLLELLPKLDARHREEIIRSHGDLERWAVDRCSQSGMAWGLYVRNELVGVGGVISHGDTGHLWLAGAEGFRDYIRHAIRVTRDLFTAGIYQRFECTCFADNEPAQRFAEYLGFRRGDVRDGLIHYGRTP